jgi:hypothetical protein
LNDKEKKIQVKKMKENFDELYQKTNFPNCKRGDFLQSEGGKLKCFNLIEL